MWQTKFFKTLEQQEAWIAKFDDLPEECKTFVLQEYVYMWDITDHPLYREN
jgi:hypothetical protein